MSGTNPKTQGFVPVINDDYVPWYRNVVQPPGFWAEYVADVVGIPALFDNTSLFASGPHAVYLGVFGSQMTIRAIQDPSAAGHQSIGLQDLTILLRGELRAESIPDLKRLLEDFVSMLTDPPHVANLVDPGGVEWKDMAFLQITPLVCQRFIDADANPQFRWDYELRFMHFGGWP